MFNAPLYNQDKYDVVCQLIIGKGGITTAHHIPSEDQHACDTFIVQIYRNVSRMPNPQKQSV